MKRCALAVVALAICLSLRVSFTSVGSQGVSDQVVTFETGKQPTAEIHVATTGSDTTGDGSATHPYATLDRAADDAVPGTAIRIHAGTYTDHAWIADLAGTADAPIWIGGAPGEARPVFDGASEAIHLVRPRYVIVHDVEVQNALYNGINADDGGDYDNPEAARYLVFRDLYIHDVGGSGNQDCLKLSGVNDYWVLDSEFAHCGGSMSGSGIDHVGCHRGLIVGNYFHDLSGNAVQNKGGSEDIEIRANHMVNSGERAVNIGGSTSFEYFRPPLSTTEPNFEARDIRVIANVIEGSTAPLAFVGTVDSYAAHNTIIDPGRWLMRILQENTSTAEYEFLESANNHIINNIFYYDRSALSSYEDVNVGDNTQPGTFTFANNLWYAHDDPSRSQPTLPAAESDGVAGQAPLFVDAGAGNYHLQGGSPAIGQGQSLSVVSVDYDGNLYNAPPTIGAFEWEPLVLSEYVYLPLVLRR